MSTQNKNTGRTISRRKKQSQPHSAANHSSDNVLQCIARIHAYGQPRSFSKPYRRLEQIKSIGTGVFVDPPRGMQRPGWIFVLTCAHVVDAADSLKVILPLVSQEELPARTLCFIPRDTYDLAIVAIADPTGSYRAQTARLALGNSDNLVQGERLIAYGFPLGQTGLKVSDGVYSGFQHLLQHTVSISPGNSGGPLVNERQELIGINNSGIVAPEASNIGYAVPIEFYKAAAPLLFSRPLESTTAPLDYLHGRPYRNINKTNPEPSRVLRTPSFGFLFQQATAALIKQVGATTGCTNGVYIYNVLSGSPFEAAGIKAGDVLTAVNGQAIDNQGLVRVNWNHQKVKLESVLQRIVDTTILVSFRFWDARAQRCRMVRVMPQDMNINGYMMKYPPYDSLQYIAFLGMCIMELCKNHRTEISTFKTYVKLNPEDLLHSQLIITHVFDGMMLAVTGALAVGQILTHINNQPVKTLCDARRAFAQPIPIRGTESAIITVTIQDGRRFSMSVDDVIQQEMSVPRSPRVYKLEKAILHTLSKIKTTHFKE